jgi:hypothetical protein
VFNLGATEGTVKVTYSGGASGGFNFTSIDGIDLEACNTQTIGGTPARRARRAAAGKRATC